MKLEIEVWARKSLGEDALSLMEESVACYKIGAYRSAYLMSYLAFKQTLRERIQKSPAYPECYENRNEWDRNVLKVLRDDDKWENFINEIVEINKVGVKLNDIFMYINREKSINKYNYWKDIRNSCAHAKDEHITSATVEQFWNYLRDNLSEFYVLGGKAYLMSELIDSYNYYISDKKKDISRLLMDIEIVYKQEIKQFFLDFLNQLMAGKKNLINDVNYEFWEAIIHCNEDAIKDAFISSICEKKEIFLDFYKYYPIVLNLIVNLDSRFIKDYINLLLCSEISYINTYKEYFWRILINSLGLQAQSIDIKSITSDYDNFILIEHIEVDGYQKALLNEHNVFKSFIIGAGRDLFKNDSSDHWSYYAWGNIKNDSYVVKYFDYVQWDLELLGMIDSWFGYLKKNVKSRRNPDSKYNGMRRIGTYNKIISNSSDRIQKFCTKQNINLEDYTNINELIIRG
ncbi:hypothetical protein [Sporosarcina limicola]|uniref:Uncharacterized protein n=1 Tax=Sporosarcina limicola TaxID=34101 RepID=A0A927MHQ5_9BACL|nr:hypothetical protein [Sporosarcina limicola]MBE1554855.1 hypothetical protein [Sporosarcina limicola]